jgi:hypothetical protein
MRNPSFALDVIYTEYYMSKSVSHAVSTQEPYITNIKLYMNVYWMVLYKLKVFCSDMKFKMAATTGLSSSRAKLGFLIAIYIYIQVYHIKGEAWISHSNIYITSRAKLEM